MSNVGRITDHVDRFFESGKSQKVWFASQTESYPENAFLVKFSRMIFVLEGSYQTAIGLQGKQEDIVVQAGEVIYIPQQTWDLPGWRLKGKSLTLLFGHYQTGMSLMSYSGDGSTMECTKHTINEPLQHEGFYLEKSLNELAESQRVSSAAPNIAEGLLRYCRDRIEEQKEITARHPNEKWRAITLYLQKNFSGKITRESVAAEYNISPNHLSRLFREEGGMGFNEYLTLVRIDRVKMLLSQYQMNMTEIAARTGFRDSSYMGRVFRRQTGMTLGEYRSCYAV